MGACAFIGLFVESRDKDLLAEGIFEKVNLINIPNNNTFRFLQNNLENGNAFTSLFPNPSTGKVFLSLNLAGVEKIAVKVFNNLGQIVHRQAYSSESANLLQLNTDKLISGIYWVQIKSPPLVK